MDRAACHELERLVNNKTEFLYTTRMTFAAAHPKFIRLLENKGLTEPEIEYCCLYAIGLKGKEIGAEIRVFIVVPFIRNGSKILYEKILCLFQILYIHGSMLYPHSLLLLAHALFKFPRSVFIPRKTGS